MEAFIFFSEYCINNFTLIEIIDPGVLYLLVVARVMWTEADSKRQTIYFTTLMHIRTW